MGKGFKGAAEENRSRRREGLKHRTREPVLCQVQVEEVWLQ